MLNKISLGKKKIPNVFVLGLKLFFPPCIHSFIQCEETTLDARDTEMECTHPKRTFKKRKQMHKPEIIVAYKSARMEVGRGPGDPWD